MRQPIGSVRNRRGSSVAAWTSGHDEAVRLRQIQIVPQITDSAAHGDKNDLAVRRNANPSIVKSMIAGSAERILKIELRQHLPGCRAVSLHISGAREWKKHGIGRGMESSSNRLRPGIDPDIGHQREIAIVNKSAAVGRNGKQRSIATGCALIVEPTVAAAPGDGSRSHVVTTKRSARAVAFGNDNRTAVTAAAN